LKFIEKDKTKNVKNLIDFIFLYNFDAANLYKMFLKQILFSKKSLISVILGLIIPCFDPYYNLSITDHIILSFKIWFASLIIISIIAYLFNKIFK
tara:strand:- start:1016 stop:1300 length:285 start_codon:yes stop_codon:yes gene_type:complete